MGDESSFPYRGFFPADDLAKLRAMLDDPNFTRRLHARTPKLSHGLRLAIGLGLEALERQYGIKP